jgi:AcrR family transcriptional regulator
MTKNQMESKPTNKKFHDNKPQKDPPTRLEAAQQAAQLKKEAQTAFLKAFMEKGTIYHAARAANVGRRTVYEWMEKDSVFKELVEDAKSDYVELLEAEADRRGVEGVDKPVGFYKGEATEHVKEYSDTLLIVRLKALAPHKYRDNHHITGNVQRGIDREMIEALMQTKEGREASDAVTKALMAQKNWNTVADKIED